MGKPAPNAFTLVELLVVIAVTSIIGVYTLANYKSFGEDQNLKSAVLDVQSQIRKAQINSTSNTKCNGNATKIWKSIFNSTWRPGPVGPDIPNTISTTCVDQSDVTFVQNTFSVQSGMVIERICGDDLACPSTASCLRTLDTYNVNITFDSLSGTMSFLDVLVGRPRGGIPCMDTVNSLTILLRNGRRDADCSDLTKCKSLILEKGGRIYAP